MRGVRSAEMPGRKMELLSAILRRMLAHPLTAGMKPDDPATTELRRHVISSKPFLKAIYDEWYRILASALPSGTGDVLELGSGAGHCDCFIPEVITSEVFPCKTARIVVDAQQLPFPDASLRAIVFTDVLHHIPEVRQFFAEASRCLRPGGRILMIEPWVTPWSRFVYMRFHHEPFWPEAQDWSFPATGPLSGANGALPWIVFVRDREVFESEFPHLRVEQVQPFLPFRYLVSGGVTMRSLMPGFTYPLWARLEQKLESKMSRIAMFAFVSVLRH
jgi:SAM-dependent methyltransferase